MENKIDPFISFDLEEGEELKLITQSNRYTPNVKENYYYRKNYSNFVKNTFWDIIINH